MDRTKVTLTREELRDLWFACCTEEEEAKKANLRSTAEDFGKLKKKLYDILTHL